MIGTAARSSDVVVIGGGVIGCAIAYEVARAGLDVTVLERAGRVAAAASGKNPGVISLATKTPGRTATLARASALLFPELLERLGDTCDYRREGSLVVFEDDQEAAYLRDRADALASQGIPLTFVDAAEAREIQPLVENGIQGALWCALDAILDPTALTAALARAAADLGVHIGLREEVLGISRKAGRVSGVRTSTGEWPAKWVVNAAGPWSAQVGRCLDITHPVSPRKGQLISTEPMRGVPCVRVTSARELVMKHGGAVEDRPAVGVGITPKPDGTVIIGGTNEDVGFDERVHAATCATIALAAARLFPRLAGVRIVGAWAGFRPGCAGGPLVEAATGVEGYVVATGHGGDGVALAPITARYVADLIGGEDAELSFEGYADRIFAGGAP